MCTSLSESLTKSIYTLDVVGKFLSSMDGSLSKEYLYSLSNIDNVYLLLHCRGNSEVILHCTLPEHLSFHVQDKSVWREFSNSIVNMSNYVLFYKIGASQEYLYSTNNNIVIL